MAEIMLLQRTSPMPCWSARCVQIQHYCSYVLGCSSITAGTVLGCSSCGRLPALHSQLTVSPFPPPT